jgi:hypothetical protein
MALPVATGVLAPPVPRAPISPWNNSHLRGVSKLTPFWTCDVCGQVLPNQPKPVLQHVIATPSGAPWRAARPIGRPPMARRMTLRTFADLEPAGLELVVGPAQRWLLHISFVDDRAPGLAAPAHPPAAATGASSAARSACPSLARGGLLSTPARSRRARQQAEGGLQRRRAARPEGCPTALNARPPPSAGATRVAKLKGRRKRQYRRWRWQRGRRPEIPRFASSCLFPRAVALEGLINRRGLQANERCQEKDVEW